MNGYNALIELLLADEFDVKTLRENAFFEKVQKALEVKRGRRGLANDLREVLYRMLVFRAMYSSGGNTAEALDQLLAAEAKLVGENNVDAIFNEFRTAVRDYFDDENPRRPTVESGIARIETLRGDDPPSRQSSPKVQPRRCPKCSKTMAT